MSSIDYIVDSPISGVSNPHPEWDMKGAKILKEIIGADCPDGVYEWAAHHCFLVMTYEKRKYEIGQLAMDLNNAGCRLT